MIVIPLESQIFWGRCPLLLQLDCPLTVRTDVCPTEMASNLPAKVDRVFAKETECDNAVGPRGKLPEARLDLHFRVRAEELSYVPPEA